jgi:hypothetical protein
VTSRDTLSPGGPPVSGSPASSVRGTGARVVRGMRGVSRRSVPTSGAPRPAGRSRGARPRGCPDHRGRTR